LDLNGAGLSRNSAVGWAYGPLEWKQPSSGYWTLPKIGTRGDRYIGFVDKLNAKMDEWQPRNVCIENPLPPFIADSTADTFRQIYALVAFVEEACARAKPPAAFSGEHVDTIRTNVAGRVWRKPLDPKAEVLRFVRQELKMPQVDDHNEADAILVWHDYRQRMMGIPSAKMPLFRWEMT
jgi:hypothetical protein